MNRFLVSEESIAAYMDRVKSMYEHKFSEKGDELFIAKLTAESEQVDNLNVKAKINEFEISCDEPKSLGGTNSAPNPMQLLLASLANCLEITALLYFAFANVNVSSVKVRVEATYDKRSVLNLENAPLPGFYNINWIYIIDSDDRVKKIERVLKKVEKYCPVKGTFAREQKFQSKLIINNKEI